MSVVLFASLVWQVIDWLRELTNLREQRSAVLTQAAAWVGGILLVALGAHAAVTSRLVLPGSDLPLGGLDFGSVVILGLLISSLASTGVDVKAAFDNTDSSRKPPLLRAAGDPVPAAPAVAVPSPVYLSIVANTVPAPVPPPEPPPEG